VLECFSYRNCNLCVRFIFSWRTTFSKRRLRLMIFWLCVILVILDFIRLNFESFVEKDDLLAMCYTRNIRFYKVKF